MEGKQPGSLLGVILTLAVTYLYSEYFATVNSPVIEITTGKIQGIVETSREGRNYYSYYSIPYARPPVGELRFEPPVAPTKWSGIRKTNKFSEECIQLEIMVTAKTQGDEDCLYLNVFTPRIERNFNKLMPVMVFFHGGLFMAGSANMYRAKYFMDEDVVLVTLNYRLAALGFLNTGDEVVRGNMGLKDQNLALKWVQANIINFGGDPRRVTIFGESAGGASVHYHMLSRASKGLFQKAISQSGTALKPWAITHDPSEQARRLGLKMKCPSNSSEELVHCLKTINARHLVQVHIAAMSPFRNQYDTFVPSIERVIRSDTFLSEDPNAIVKKGDFRQVPWMTGVNAGEGLFNMGRLLSDKSLLRRLVRDWNRLAPLVLSYDPRNLRATEEIRNYYFGSTFRSNPEDYVENFTRLFSDRNFFQATHKAAMIHSQKAHVFLYYLSYAGETSLFNLFKWISPFGILPVELQVASEVVREFLNYYILGIKTPNYGQPCHADDLPLLFPMHFFAEIGKSGKDYKMSKALVKLWADFARDDRHLKFKNTYWPPLDANQTTLKYLNLNERGGLIDEPFENRLKFWDSLNL